MRGNRIGIGAGNDRVMHIQCVQNGGGRQGRGETMYGVEEVGTDK